MKQKFFFFLLSFILMGCGDVKKEPKSEPSTIDKQINPKGTTLKTRFIPPVGFKRVKAEQGSFAEYLRNLPLKEYGHPTHYYNGAQKNNKVQCGVVDMDLIGNDLQQCADVIIRLRAEYLYKTKQYKKICFHFTNGFPCDYLKWKEGYRIRANSSHTETWWVKQENADSSYSTFREYLEQVFFYAGTLSLEQELNVVPTGMRDAKIGDVLINGGTPGHAVIIVDVAENKGGEKVFLLAQSYMPAQELEILAAPFDNEPWHPQRSGECDGCYITKEWTFTPKDELFLDWLRTWE